MPLNPRYPVGTTVINKATPDLIQSCSASMDTLQGTLEACPKYDEHALNALASTHDA